MEINIRKSSDKGGYEVDKSNGISKYVSFFEILNQLNPELLGLVADSSKAIMNDLDFSTH